ncbi:hypothetical protein RI054_24g101930 [Pseudoscourfieldia marina]
MAALNELSYDSADGDVSNDDTWSMPAALDPAAMFRASAQLRTRTPRHRYDTLERNKFINSFQTDEERYACVSRKCGEVELKE